MPRKTKEIAPRKATRAEERFFLEERAARRNDPIGKRKKDLKNIAARSRAERDEQVHKGFGTTEVLDLRQKKIIVELEDAFDEWRDSLGLVDVEDNETLKHFEAADAAYDKIIGKAIRAGILDHPLVRERLSVLRNFGERDVLRGYSKTHCLDTGVKRAMKKVDLWTAFYASKFAAQGKRPAAIHRALIRSLVEPKPVKWLDLTREELRAYGTHLKNIKRQAFHKLLRRLHVICVAD